MSRAQRFDTGGLSRSKKLPNGFLRADAFLTRTGVFTYRNPDGSERRELRLPEEVFKADSLETLENTVMTLDHPAGSVTARNAASVAIGSVGTPRRDGDRVRSPIVLHDDNAIREAQSGRRKDVSCGYWCRLDHTPGTHKGERYDAIQRDIVYNHAALVARGRAGPEIGGRFDAGDDVDDVAWCTDSMDAPADERSDDEPPASDLKAGDADETRDDRDIGRGEAPQMAFAARIRRGMADRGLTSGEVASTTGMREDAFQATLKGERSPTNEEVARIAQALDVSGKEIEDLFPETPRRDAPREEQAVKTTIKIDGYDHEVEQTTALAIGKEREAHADALGGETVRADEAAKATETEKARADSAEEKLTEAEKTRKDSESKFGEAVKDRVELERAATSVEVKIDGQSDDDIRKAVVIKLRPDAEEKLDGCSTDYLRARFDDAIESADAEKDRKDQAATKRGKTRKAASEGGDDEMDEEGMKDDSIDSVSKSRNDMHDRNDKSWQTPLAANKATAGA